MNIAIISFTRNGFSLSEKITNILRPDHQIEQYVKSKYLEMENGMMVKECLPEWAGKMFAAQDGIIFIGASGIAVRAIASHVQDKRYDPAVLVLDEKGRFCIPLLAGHLGGANQLASQLSSQLGAQAVITTATDVNQCFAVDLFAKKNQLQIADMVLAKEVSAKLLQGEVVGFISELPVQGEIPQGLMQIDPEFPGQAGIPELGIYVGIKRNQSPFLKTLYLIPAQLVLGMGCQKGVKKEVIAQLVEEICSAQNIFTEGILCICSIDLKQNEPGLLAYSQEQKLDLITYSAAQLRDAAGVYTASDFVAAVTGVDNVCERSARLGSGMGRLIQKKTAKNGVTAALALIDRRIDFE